MTKTLYAIDQCALYKVGSKARLASILGTSSAALVAMAHSPKYRLFELEAETCPFTGNVRKARGVQEPVGTLRRVHVRLQRLLMRMMPPSYAHAAVKGRSYRSNAAYHASSRSLATFDIRKFYPSTSAASVFRFFAEQLRCAPDVARLMTELVTFKADVTHARSLATGSPLSPVLSIYANKPMFDALNVLGEKHDLKFSCYVDDLTYSGEMIPSGLERMVKVTVERFGHSLAEDKSRVYRGSGAKHVTGVVLASGELRVPYSRFKKARRIELAIDGTSDATKKLELTRKLAGLLGEAAFLDSRYGPWAKGSYRRLADAVLAAPPVPAPSKPKKSKKTAAKLRLIGGSGAILPLAKSAKTRSKLRLVASLNLESGSEAAASTESSDPKS